MDPVISKIRSNLLF